jgi:hypothetical protein
VEFPWEKYPFLIINSFGIFFYLFTVQDVWLYILYYNPNLVLVAL